MLEAGVSRRATRRSQLWRPRANHLSCWNASQVLTKPAKTPAEQHIDKIVDGFKRAT
jgi:hypothetical protein